MSIDNFFVPGFTAPHRWAWRLTWDAANGRMPMISFGSGVDTRKIAAGAYDSILRDFADAISEYGGRVLLRYAWEMDGVNNQSWVHSGPDYVAAWRHVHEIFRGLPVQWIWAPNAVAFAGAHGGVDQYWPGDDVVDWIGADGYNFYTCLGGDTWRSFSAMFSAFSSWRPDLTQPRMIAEFGTVSDPTREDRMGKWLNSVSEALSRMPSIKAIVYFNSNTHGCDFRLGPPQTSAGTVQQFGASSNLTARLEPSIP